MELYLDSANLNEIEEAFQLGFIDGLTTTPTFMHRHGITDIDNTILKLSKMVPVLQIEALGSSAEEIVAEANRLLDMGLSKEKTVFKIPASLEAAKACKMLRSEDIMVNIHLVYNFQQAYTAAAAGANYICVLVGRMQDQGYDALQLISDCVGMIDHYGFDCKVMFSSVRNPEHIKNALHLGAHTCTIPWSIIKQMNKNDFTEIGTQQFFAHTRQMTMTVKEAIEKSNNPTVSFDTTVLEATVKMTTSGLGIVSVVNGNGSLAGVFTDGDLRRHLNKSGKDALSKTMRDIAICSPVSIDADDMLGRAVDLIKDKEIDNIIVVSGGKPVGILDIQDLLRLNVIEQ